MNSRNLTAGATGAACAVIGPAVTHAFTNDPAEQLALSLMIAGSVVVAVLVGVRRQ
ncbi:hypothetical protein [Methylobacterium planeticum]|uniref:hypothetical protein n=1 Tax=Methylobacterium planeticum TaxID=2615211 RepID=UPI00177F333C|nr:hypothetical protein [Methylobacterium planeticum]